MNEVKEGHAEEVSFWKETSAEKVNSLINDVNVENADSVKMSVERNLVLVRFGDHVCAL